MTTMAEFNNLSKGDMLVKAAEIASRSGVKFSPQDIDGLWRTESGRGANMLSSAGAEGHTQIMPATRRVMEKRFGQSIDPYKLGDALFTTAHLLEENARRFGNINDALRAYNGGWDPKKWVNPETAAYAGKVRGAGYEPNVAAGLNVSTTEAVSSGAAVRFLTSDEAYEATPPFQKGVPMKKTAASAAALGNVLPTPTVDATRSQQDNLLTQQNFNRKVKDAEVESATALSTLRAAADSSLVVNGLKWATRERYEADPSFVLKEDALRGYTADEQSDLADARSQAEFDRIKFDLDDRREQQRLTNLNGEWWGFGASMLSDLPGAVLTGGTATVGAKAIGLGSLRLAAAGRKGAALGANLAENVAGNIGATALLDASGYDQGSADYALGALAGAVFGPGLAGRSIGRIADEAGERAAASAQAAFAVAQQAKLAETASRNLGPGADPAALRAEMARLDAQVVKTEIASHRADLPASRRIVEDGLLDENGLPVEKTHTVEGEAPAPKAEPEAPRLNGEQEPPAQADMRPGTWEGAAPSREAQAPRWEDPKFHTDRQAALMARDEWQASLKHVSDGVVVDGNVDAISGIKMTEAVAADPALSLRAKSISEMASKYGINNLLITNKVTGGENGVIMSFGDKHIIGLAPGSMPSAGMHTAWHELGHAIYHQHAPSAPVELMARINADWGDFAKRAQRGDSTAWQKRWAITSPNREGKGLSNYALSRDEYMAEQFVKHVQNMALSGQYGGKLSKGVVSQITYAVEAIMKYINDLIGNGFLKSDKAANEFFRSMFEGGFNSRVRGEELLAPDLRLPTVGELGAKDKTLPDALVKEVKDFMANPIARKYGLDLLPLETPAQRAEAKVMLSVYTKADNPAAAWNNIDKRRLNKLLAAAPDSWGLNPTSNSLLKSDNPVARMLATELIENGGGAAGRQSTAAIAKYMNEGRILGNSINDLQTVYKAYRQAAGGTVLKDFTNGQDWRAFNKAIAEEIEMRRGGNTASEAPDSVRAGADIIEAAYERARQMQVSARTPGWASLAPTSVGYMPHRMSTETVRNLNLAQKRALHEALTDQFITTTGFDPTFADKLASKYLDLVNRRALGGFEANVGIHQTGAADVVKEALEQMDLTRPEIDAMMKRYTSGGAGHTKKRLDLDMNRVYQNEDGTSFRLLDLFETDQFKLLRSQAQRVSGEAALARHGIMGRPGLALMRRAMEFGDAGTKVKGKEMEAYDQIAAEFLGQPFGSQNKWVDRAMQANSLSSLGGMGFNQLGEMINMALTLGVKSAMQNVAGMPRLWKEVHALAKGKTVENGWLTSIEQFGGREFGTDNHKMVFPFDVPDHPYATMGADSVSGLDRVLRGGTHLQGTLSGWRALHSVQLRGAAEQIVMKSMRMVRDGTDSVALRDMGITKELEASLKAELNRIAKWDVNGRMIGLDISRMENLDAANAYVQAVHRGANQIIQGTFIGETGKYAHSSWGRLMTQFRSFSLTGIDKQWARQKGNHGVVKALAMTMGAMSMAAPIYIARTAVAAQGRADADEYLEKQLHPTQIGRATLNYIATSGLSGDFLDALTALTGVGEATGARSGAKSDFVGNIIAPALGKADKVWGAGQGVIKDGDVHGLIKELPFGRLPWLIPAINTLGD